VVLVTVSIVVSISAMEDDDGTRAANDNSTHHRRIRLSVVIKLDNFVVLSSEECSSLIHRSTH